MPVTKSATKAHRQSLTKRSRNKHFLALYRESLKAFQKGIASGAKDIATLLSSLQSSIDTLVKKNILHKNTAARRKSAAAKLLAKGSTGSAAPAKAPKAAKTAAPKAVKAPKAAKEEASEAAPAKKPAAKKAPAAKTESKKAPAKKAK